jgi:hypothetical protein
VLHAAVLEVDLVVAVPSEAAIGGTDERPSIRKDPG